MSVSDNSTIAPSSDVDGPFQSLDERSEAQQPSNEAGVAKKVRRARRSPRSTAATYGTDSLDGSNMLKEDYNDVPNEDEADVFTEKSPYAVIEIVFLHVGKNATPFSVHGTILAKSAVLAAKYDQSSMVGQHISIPEIDNATAHTLIHYLYTDRFHDLYSPLQSGQATVSSYKVGTCVYCAAVRYDLPGLVDLAKEKVASLGESVGISDILKIAKDNAFPLLPDNETWYLTYLEDAVRSAMTKDPEPFRRPDFITQVEGNTRLLQVVWKTVMSNFANTPIAKTTETDKSSTSTIEPRATESAPKDAKEPKKEDAQAINVNQSDQIEESKLDWTAHNYSTESADPLTASDLIRNDSLRLEDIEPTLDTNHELESFTDELGFEKIKTYQKMSKKESGAELLTSPISEGLAELKRSDSVMQVEQAVTTPSQEEPDEVGKVGDVVSGAVNDASEANSVPKKSKKSKKKKSSIVF
ncbi:hypothetical protein CC86DRAFT_362283 [Ophiobolus disseminans]|uniref:BTB domain-containing protein n=1 Tax=Ophiobolus disseminans TaxID=1469910 RepID=A0A6A6ZF50_9PLEO|nr:hypothetical protein CC86DRAFT_362283 [Ophiobolus disseminans]